MPRSKRWATTRYLNMEKAQSIKRMSLKDCFGSCVRGISCLNICSDPCSNLRSHMFRWVCASIQPFSQTRGSLVTMQELWNLVESESSSPFLSNLRNNPLSRRRPQRKRLKRQIRPRTQKKLLQRPRPQKRWNRRPFLRWTSRVRSPLVRNQRPQAHLYPERRRILWRWSVIMSWRRNEARYSSHWLLSEHLRLEALQRVEATPQVHIQWLLFKRDGKFSL